MITCVESSMGDGDQHPGPRVFSFFLSRFRRFLGGDFDWENQRSRKTKLSLSAGGELFTGGALPFSYDSLCSLKQIQSQLVFSEKYIKF